MPEGIRNPLNWPGALRSAKANSMLASVRCAGNTGNSACAAPATPLICRVPSYETKKKVSLSLGTGPPKFPPNWFCLSSGLGEPVALKKNKLAFMSSLRKNSYASP